MSRNTPTNVVGGVYNATPPVFADHAFVAFQFDASGNLLTTGGGSGSNASVNPVGTPVPGSATMIGWDDGSGNTQFVSAANPLPITGTISASNPSVGSTGSTAPTSATEMGVIDGSGNLRGVSATYPMRVDPTGTTTQPVSFGALPAGTNQIGLVAQGTAAALTAGWPTVDGLLAPVTATWTSSTTTNTAITLSNTQGYATALLTLNQTNSMNLFTVIGEGYDGTNWVAIATQVDGSGNTLLGTIVLGATTTQHFYQFNIVGFQQFRIRVTVATIAGGQAVFALSAQATPITNFALVSGIIGAVTLGAGSALVGKVDILGNAGVALDAVLGATKPANVLQVGGNDGTNAYAVPLASGGASVVVTGTGTLPVQNTAATPAGTNLIGQVSSSDETSTLYSGTTALTPKFAVVTASSSGVTNIIAAVSSKHLRVLALQLTANAAVNVKWQSHVTPTDITGLAYLAANGGYVLPYNPLGWFQTVAGEALDINLSGAVAVGGSITYVEVS